MEVNGSSSTKIRVTWGEVLENERNGNITRYEVEYSQSTFMSVQEVGIVSIQVPEMTAMLNNLEEFVEYSVRVRAYTVAGSGPFSQPVAESTLQSCK